MAYKLTYSDYSTTTEGPPDPERWVGPPGPTGPAGPTGPQGPAGADGAGSVHSVAGKIGDVTLVHTDITDWAASTSFLPLSGGTVLGPLVLPNLPTSNAGLAPGTLWNNGGFVCVA